MLTHDEIDSKFRDLRNFLRDEISDMRIDLRERLDGCNERLDVLNGRTRDSEVQIAVLNDRSERAEVAATAAVTAAAIAADSARTQARDTGWKWGGGAGAGIAGVVVGLWKFFSRGDP